jgi:hypothetical protein
MNIDRVLALAKQRCMIEKTRAQQREREQREAAAIAAERRLKLCLARDEATAVERERRVVGRLFLRTMSAASTTMVTTHRERFDTHKQDPRAHPNDEGRKPFVTNYPNDNHPRLVGGRRVFEEI